MKVAGSQSLLLQCTKFLGLPPYIGVTYTGDAMKSINLNSRNIMLASVAVFSILFLITLLGMLIPLAGDATLHAKWFNDRTVLPTLVLMILLGVCLLLPDFSQQKIAGIVAAVVVVTGLCVALKPFNSLPIDATLPTLAFAMLAVFYRGYKSAAMPGSMQIKIRRVSPHIIHLGIVLILIGIFVSTNTRIDGSEVISKGEIGNYDGQPYSVKITGISGRYEGAPLPEYPGSSYATSIDFELYSGERLIDRDTVKFITDYKWGQSYATNYVYRSLTKEVFITTKMVEGDLVNLYMRTAPWISAVWGGILLMSIGIVLLMYTVGTKTGSVAEGVSGETGGTEEKRRKGRKEKPDDTTGEACRVAEAVDEADIDGKYEAMLREELEKLKER